MTVLPATSYDVPAATTVMRYRGRIMNVTREVAGTWLSADAAAGAGTITVDTEVEVGDVFAFPDLTPATVSAVSEDHLTATLSPVLAVAQEAGAFMTTQPPAWTVVAMVSQGTGDDDPLQAYIPLPLQGQLTEGMRSDTEAESVIIRTDDEGNWWVEEITGAEPVVPGSGTGIATGIDVGTILAWGNPIPPATWLTCDGALKERAMYPDLFTVIGTTFGAGDGSTTFALPNLTGKVIQGSAAPGGTGGGSHTHGNGALGTDSQAAHAHGSAVINVSSNTHDHGIGQLDIGSNGGHSHGSAGSHSHGSTGPSNADVGVPSGSFWQVGTGLHEHSTSSGGSHSHGSVGDHAHGITGSTGDASHTHNLSGNGADAGGHSHVVTGTSDATTAWPPYLALIYIIKAVTGGAGAGGHVEVRDEGVTDIAVATVLNFEGAGVDVQKSGLDTARIIVGAQSGVTDHGALTGNTDDDHTQYLTNARGDARYSLLAHLHAAAYEPLGAVATHAAAADPHTVYTTGPEADAKDIAAVAVHNDTINPHPGSASDADVTAAVDTHLTSHPHEHPDAAAHDAMGVVIDTTLNAHATLPTHHPRAHVVADALEHTFPGGTANFLRSDGSWTAPTAAHADLATHDALGLQTDAEAATHAALTTHHAKAHAADHAEAGADPLAGYVGTQGLCVIDGNGLNGTSTALKARGDHSHRVTTGSGTPTALAAAGAAGTLGSAPSRGDHVHPYTGLALPADITSAVSAHAALADPHTGYRLESADHTHQSAGLQGGQIAEAALATTDVTTGNATTAKHGFLSKLPGGTTTFLRADGTWATVGTASHPTLAEHETMGLQTDADAAAHVAAADPHPGYETTAEGAARVSAHEGLADPHPGYTTQAEQDAALLALVPPGCLQMYGGAVAPTGWQLCEGQAISRTTYAALYAVIGTTYGIGDGSTTFNVPNFRGRMPLGKAVSGTGATLGSFGGAMDHDHGPGDLSTGASGDIGPNATNGTANRVNNAHGHNVNAGRTGATNPPFLAVQFIIKT